jgi:hypothetical protein
MPLPPTDNLDTDQRRDATRGLARANLAAIACESAGIDPLGDPDLADPAVVAIARDWQEAAAALGLDGAIRPLGGRCTVCGRRLGIVDISANRNRHKTCHAGPARPRISRARAPGSRPRIWS